MSDEQSVSSSGKSKEEIAFELVSKLKGQGVWGERNKSDILDMYAECLIATKGQRIVEGLTAADQPLTPQPVPAAPVSQAAPVQPPPAQTAPVQAVPTQAAPAQVAQRAQTPPTQAAPAQAQSAPPQQSAAQPVHQQQQAVTQAFKQG